MQKTILSYLIIFFVTFFVYFGVGTKFTFQPKWQLDYFNLMAKSLQEFRLDIVNSGTTYDLVFYKDKWYAPWGVLPAVLLIPPQLVLGRFIPAFYLSILFAGLNAVVLYALLQRVRREFFPKTSSVATLLTTVLFAFGTTHFYVGTLGSSWHVDQMVSSFLGTLGIFAIFKKERKIKDYILSAILFAASLLGRPTFIMLMVLPFFLYVWEYFYKRKQKSVKVFLKMAAVFGIPVVLFSFLFFFYNYVRFEYPFEYGYRYIRESAYLEQVRERLGILSLSYIPINLWFMVFEIPRISLQEGRFFFNFNLVGNSIFFLTLPFLAAFLAPMRNHYILFLWLTTIVTILPSLMIYSTGWMQFGYRYSLDITVLLILLTFFGMRGKVNILYILGIIVSICLYLWGIFTLM